MPKKADLVESVEECKLSRNNKINLVDNEQNDDIYMNINNKIRKTDAEAKTIIKIICKKNNRFIKD